MWEGMKSLLYVQLNIKIWNWKTKRPFIYKQWLNNFVGESLIIWNSVQTESDRVFFSATSAVQFNIYMTQMISDKVTNVVRPDSEHLLSNTNDICNFL